VDSRGTAYVGGRAGVRLATGGFGIPNTIPALAGVPNQCLPDNDRIHSVAYVSAVDAAKGDILTSQFVGGSTLATTGLALSGSTAWISGTTSRSDVPLTPGALTLPSLPPTEFPGAYLGAVSFTAAQSSTPRPKILCIVDAADLAPVGAAAISQLLTIFGTGLGPDEGISAEGDSASTLGGVSIDAGDVAAPLLYASSNQINFAVPVVSWPSSFADITVKVDGAAADPLRIPLAFSNPSLFLDPTQPATSLGAVAYAANADGSVNSPSNPAKLGETISVWVNGLMRDPRVITNPVQLQTTNGWSVAGITAANPFVLRVSLRTPPALVNQFSCAESGLCSAGFALYEVGFVSTGEAPTTGEAFGGTVYVDRGR
jgi:uncharacterized protein (TIGR03437 family)